MSQDSIKILHISDIHFGINKYAVKEDYVNKDEILNKLIDFLNALPENEKPKHILFTGDIVWRGKKSEYDEAIQWFSKLLHSLNLKGEDISFCVGNHDINWDHSNAYEDFYDEMINESKNYFRAEIVRKIDDEYNYENLYKYEASLYNYNEFCETMKTTPYSYIYNDRIDCSYSVGYKDITVNHRKIRIVAFNTAVFSFLNGYKDDRMWIGQSQVKKLIEYGILKKGNEDFTISLMHHSDRFLSPNEICEYDNREATLPMLQNNSDLILCGHTETGSKPILYEQKDGGKLLTGGATYYSDTHPNSFSILTIEADSSVNVDSYVYKSSKWSFFPSKKPTTIRKIIKPLPIYETKNDCLFKVKGQDFTNEINVGSMNLYKSEIDGVQYEILINDCSVNRNIDFIFGGRMLSQNTATINMSLAPRKINSIEAYLKQKIFFDSIKDGPYNVWIENSNQDRVAHADATKFSVTPVEGEIDIATLIKLREIEKAFDIKLKPGICGPSEECLINLLNSFVNKEKIQIRDNRTSSIDVEFDNEEEINEIYEHLVKGKSIQLYKKGILNCKLFDNQISLGEVIVCLGNYDGNIDIIKKLKDTFMPGDKRLIKFVPQKNNVLSIIKLDIEKQDEDNGIECNVLSQMNIDLSPFYFNEHDDTKNKVVSIMTLYSLN